MLTNIFSGFNIADAMNKTDDWALTKEETVKYQLEWLRAMPSGFQLAQRLIGVSFSFVFLIMVLTTFVLLACGMEVEDLIIFISGTMSQPLMIIFSLFFGGGLINSFKNGGRGWNQEVAVNESKMENKKTVFAEKKILIKPTRREKRQLRKK